jgi:hypothetical protein
VVRNNLIVLHRTYDVKPAVHEFSTVPASHRTHQHRRYPPTGLCTMPIYSEPLAFAQPSC